MQFSILTCLNNPLQRLITHVKTGAAQALRTAKEKAADHELQSATMSERKVAMAGTAAEDLDERVPATPNIRDVAPAVPQLKNNEAASPGASETVGHQDVLPRYDNADPTVARPLIRASSLDSVPSSSDEPPSNTPGLEAKGSLLHSIHKMHKFSLYETASRYYVVGVDVSETRYRILKIDRTTEGAELNMTDDKIIYTLTEINQLLDTIDDGNRGTGGIKLRCTTWGILGFIKFTGPYYMLLITKKSTVAMVGGHYVYQVEGTELIPLTPGKSRADTRNTEEQRFLGILNNLDLTKSFYYSYSYDVTRTLQHNIVRERTALIEGRLPLVEEDINSMFVWNSYLLEPGVRALRDAYSWCRPIIHGYVDQAGTWRCSW